MPNSFKIAVFVLSAFSFSGCLSQEEAQEEIDYSACLLALSQKQDALALEFAKADPAEKQQILTTARHTLLEAFANEILPAWYGTEWDFNGMTRTPGTGKIACGYFVTNTLSDAGFNIPRVQWAQSASEVFIKKLAFGNIKHLINQPISKVEEQLLDMGNGLYLVGLDMHVGYLLVDKGVIQFIHADYYEPEIGVVSEEIDSHSPIKDSKYRVIGKLLEDEMIEMWLTDQNFE